jgi:hypothetical protein
MELAIPLVALGGLYLISNQKEGFRPSIQRGEILKSESSKAHATSDRFYNVQSNPSSASYTDLAGRTVNTEYMTGNMVPMLGTQKSIGQQIRDQSEHVMDAYTGSQTFHMNKTEVAPLFKPQENVQWANGAPSSTEFYQSRVNPGLRVHNVKPFEETYVAPGLNHGYTNQGSGGFNSGMEARSTWIPKTVDELRSLTNQKATSFGLENHQGPAQTLVKNLGFEGKMEKHLPDKFYINTGTERMLTTTGVEIGATRRAIQPDPTIHRATTTQSYSGVAGNSGVEKQPQHGLYRLDHRQQLGSETFTPAGSSVTQNNLSTMTKSIMVNPTNRAVTNTDTMGGIKGLVSAITAPITDILRPSRKELSQLNRLGNGGSTVPNLPSMETVPSKTIRDGTSYSPYERGNRPYNPITDGGYQVNQHQPVENQRDTTSISYMGIGGSTMPKPVSYEDSYNATIMSNRSTEGRTAGGNITTFQPYVNSVSSSTKIEHVSSYIGNAKSMISVPPTMKSDPLRTPQYYAEPDRNTPDMLTQFKQNPYTHSLHSVA